MARRYTAEELIATVVLRAAVPNTQATGTSDDDILLYINEAMSTELIPWLVSFREEFFVVGERIAVSSERTRYRVNARALGNGWRDAMLVDSNGDRRQPLPVISREDIYQFDAAYLASTAEGFYLEGNDLVLVRSSTGSGSLELPFLFRPGQLVKSTECREITAVDAGNKQVTVATSPSGWTTGSLFDIHSGRSGAEIKTWDLTPNGDPGSQTTITFNETIDGSVFGRQAVEAGDWLCLAEEAALPGIPRELHPILAQAAVCATLRGLGDIENMVVAQRELDRMQKRAESLIEKRVKGKTQKVTGDQSPLWQGYSHYHEYGPY